jgi:hypothetical protein
MQVSFLFYRMLVVDGHRRSLFTSEVGLFTSTVGFFVARSDTKALEHLQPVYDLLLCMIA